jgi:hypothetical protein
MVRKDKNVSYLHLPNVFVTRFLLFAISCAKRHRVDLCDARRVCRQSPSTLFFSSSRKSGADGGAVRRSAPAQTAVSFRVWSGKVEPVSAKSIKTLLSVSALSAKRRRSKTRDVDNRFKRGPRGILRQRNCSHSLVTIRGYTRYDRGLAEGFQRFRGRIWGLLR